jgi:Zn-dependent protease
MLLFQAPPPTRFDLRFSIDGIPVRVHPLFWIIALLFGSGTGSVIGTLVWIFAIFLSILIHELGHALAMRRYGQDSQIILHFAGGLTVPTSVAWGGGYASVALTPGQHILISLAGPFAGFFLAALVVVAGVALGGRLVLTSLLGFIPFPMVLMPGGGIAASLVLALLWVNIFWGIINLMPVHPLDGGNVTRHILTQYDPWNGVRTSLWISVATGAALAVAGFLLLGSLYMALIFGLLAFQSFQMLQGTAPGRY